MTRKHKKEINSQKDLVLFMINFLTTKQTETTARRLKDHIIDHNLANNKIHISVQVISALLAKEPFFEKTGRKEYTAPNYCNTVYRLKENFEDEIHCSETLLPAEKDLLTLAATI